MGDSQKQALLLGDQIEEFGKGIVEGNNWTDADKRSIKDPDELFRFISMSNREKQFLRTVVGLYRMRIPEYYFSLIKNRDDPNDSIRMQCVPSPDELAERICELSDPLEEEKTSPTSFLVHRYPDRVLLLVTNRCFMYCRHCTRKRLWKNENFDISSRELDNALDYVRIHKNIREIVISGGDPLTLSTDKIDDILSRISKISHVAVTRIGTRAPIVLPKRIDDGLCAVLERYDNLWVNIQFNHPREITTQSIAACRKLQKCGIPLSNQSVLLKGVNDSFKVMKELCQKLQAIRVRPYYLFYCDPVVGAGHFRTQLFKGVEILKKMQGNTSGMCLPNFVVDGIEGKGKVPISANYLISQSREGVFLRNYKDEIFFYPAAAGKSNSDQEKMNLVVHNIGIIFNLKKNNDGSDSEEEYDDMDTVKALEREIKNLGFEVSLFEQNSCLVNKLSLTRPDFVFNIAEGIGCGRARESQVPCILESLKIPYSGSDAIALGIALDKFLTNTILKSAAIPVPEAVLVRDSREINNLKGIFEKNKTVIVKPCWEGSSKGIFSNSLVNNLSDLSERLNYIHSQYRQPALVEEFIEGDEITVGVYGNAQPRLLGMMRISLKQKTEKPFIYSLEIKRRWKESVVYSLRDTIPLNIQKLVEHYALATYCVLGLRDFARIDFRVGSDLIPRVIDVNPLPGFSPYYSDLPILYGLAGGTYSNLIKILLRESLKRYNLNETGRL